MRPYSNLLDYQRAELSWPDDLWTPIPSWKHGIKFQHEIWYQPSKRSLRGHLAGTGFHCEKIEKPWRRLHDEVNLLLLSCIPNDQSKVLSISQGRRIDCFKNLCHGPPKLRFLSHASSQMKEAKSLRCTWIGGSRPVWLRLVLKRQKLAWLGPFMLLPPQLFIRCHERTHSDIMRSSSVEIGIHLKILVLHLASPRGDLVHSAKRKVVSLFIHLTPTDLLHFPILFKSCCTGQCDSNF